MTAQDTPAPLAELFDPTSEEPLLKGNRCAVCGTGYFPRLRWGCEVCGAGETSLLDETFNSDGKLWARARIIGPAGEHFMIAEIALMAGPKIRVLLDGDEGVIGDSMRAVWRPLQGDPATREPRWISGEAGR